MIKVYNPIFFSEPERCCLLNQNLKLDTRILHIVSIIKGSSPTDRPHTKVVTFLLKILKTIHSGNPFHLTDLPVNSWKDA